MIELGLLSGGCAGTVDARPIKLLASSVLTFQNLAIIVLVIMSLLRDLKVVIPVCLVIGAGMELFMIKTGFYNVAVRKASERKDEADSEVLRRQRRLKELAINFEEKPK